MTGDANDVKGPENSGRNAAGQFVKGNAVNPGGKPKGARHAVTLAVEALLDGEAEGLTRVAIERALNGDMIALRLCLDRIAPARKERTVQFDLPPIKTAADLIAANEAVAAGVASGELTPNEASALSTIVGGVGKAIELVETEKRLAALEATADKKGSRP